MTLAAEQAKAAKRFDYLLEIEAGHRIDIHTWVQEGAPNVAVFSTSHPEGQPSRVKACDRATHAITTYSGPADGITSIAACQAAASSWYYDSATGTLYVHMSGGNSPSTAGAYYLSSFFWECICAGQRKGSQALYFNGKWYQPALNESSIPEVSLETSMFSEGGIRKSFGTISLINTNGYFDDRVNSHYIYSGKRAVLKVGAPGAAYAAFKPLLRFCLGNVRSNDERVELNTEDERTIAD